MTPTIHVKRNRWNNRGLMQLLTLVELILGIFVIAIIGLGLVSMLSGMSFTQSYFAKDNAHLLEALHAVPNGKLSYGYLWNTKNYDIEFSAGQVAVTEKIAIIPRLQDSGICQGASKCKAYGTSKFTDVTKISFFPKYYEFVYSRIGDKGGITISQRFDTATCAPAPDLPGLSSFSTSSAQGKQGKEFLDQVTTRVRALRSQTQPGKPFESGPNIQLLIDGSTRGQTSGFYVYDIANTPETRRLSCIIAHMPNARADVIANAPLELATNKDHAQIAILVVGIPDQLPTLQESLIQTILEYWRVDAGSNSVPSVSGQPAPGFNNPGGGLY